MPALNGLCTCGSGKKYKRCCGLLPDKKNKHSHPFEYYNTFDLLQNVAALTLLPPNHGKQIRLEKISRQIVIDINSSNQKITLPQLQSYLSKKFPADSQEDPPVNLFTEIVAFFGGDHIIFPGITESTSFVLSNLLHAIFNWPDTAIVPQFKTNCRHAIRIMLLLSEHMARKGGYTRYMAGEQQEQLIQVSEENIMRQLKAAVTISKEELTSICNEYDISPEALEPFIVNLHDQAFLNNDETDSPFVRKPIIATDNGYIIASPATMSFALTEFIKEEAVILGCEDQLHDSYHELVWARCKMQLTHMNFEPMTIEGVAAKNDHAEQIIIARFDTNKIAVIQFIPCSQIAKMRSSQELANERKELLTHIKAQPQFADFEFLDLTICSSMGNDINLLTIGNDISQTVSMPVYDFDILCDSKSCDAIDLYKFAIARDKQLPRMAKLMSLSFLDEYKIYKDHGNSFYLSDEGFDISKWTYAHAQNIVREVKRKKDEHSVAIRSPSGIASTVVRRKDKYAPIYLSLMDMVTGNLQFEVEGFMASVWVIPKMHDDVTGDLRDIYWELTDAISYWMWQITVDVKKNLDAIGSPLLSITYELNDPSRFENIDDQFIRDPKVYEKLQISSGADYIHLIIPSEIMPYFFGPDNEGDQIIVRQLLLGINDLLLKKGITTYTQEEIANIITVRAGVTNKKKFIILHSRSNLLLDTRKLTEYRYIQDYDESVAADSIGRLLGPILPPVGEIKDPAKKAELVKNIVIKGLLPQLKNIISHFNNEELIQWLIGLNEALIQRKEDLRLKTPTRIACFVSQEQHQHDLQEEFSKISRTTIAVRCLLEHVAAEPGKGKKKLSQTAVDEMVAIMDEIILWGSIGDQLNYNLFDINIGILSTGRIGTQKNLSQEIFDPYYQSKTKETVIDALHSFEQEFKADFSDVENGIPQSLDNSFLKEFNISFTRICIFIDALTVLSFEQPTPYNAWKKKSLYDALNMVEKFLPDEFNNALAFLSLTNRGNILKVPKGFENYDISPWRFNRRLSLLRKPLIICDTDDLENPIIYWGFRQILLSRMTIAEQCINNRLKVSENSPVAKVMGKLAQQRGSRLVTEVLQQLKLEDTILDTEVMISPNGKLKHISDIGDIDVLLIHLPNKVIYSLECKSFAPSRNIKEMVEECEKLQGSKSEKGLIAKHQNRHQWIITHLDQMGKVYEADLAKFSVVSAFVTREDMLFPYLKKIGITMPFLTLYDLREKGFAALQLLS